MRAIEKKEVEAASIYLRAVVISSACTSGMGKVLLCVFFIGRIKGWRLEPERLLGLITYAGKKKEIFLALWGMVEMICRIPKRITESIRERLHAVSQNFTAICFDKLSKRDPAIYSMLKQRKTTCPSPVPTDAWNTYLLSHFDTKPPPKPPDTLKRKPRHTDALASAVPLGRGRISQGMNRTADANECLTPPANMTCLVSTFLGEMSECLFFTWFWRIISSFFWNTLIWVMEKIKIWSSLPAQPLPCCSEWGMYSYLLGKIQDLPPLQKRL